MVEANADFRSTERADDLVLASVYERVVGASLERVWENVYDWEHLPHLHSQAFHSIERRDSGDWGWAARIGIGPRPAEDVVASGGAPEIELELVTRKVDRCYVSRTLRGPGAPSEIWTHLDPVASDRTAIRVEFWVSSLPEDALANVGRRFVELYTQLWDQDESMMQTREAALSDRSARRPEAARPAPKSLGPIDALRAKLPFVTTFGDRSYCVVEVDGDLVAFARDCPHMLGPLDEGEIAGGRVVCPWHGYAFDVRTGQSCDGRHLLLSRAPSVVVDPDRGEVELRARPLDA